MSSTSFSSFEYYDEECNCVLEDHYGRIMETVPHQLYYQTMAEPLIYYAQVQPYNVQSTRAEKRKANKNYFVKAFKWYTQERPPENKRIRSAELRRFATWLDTKYSEYLRDTEIKELRPTDSECCRTNVPGTTKRFARFKRPWGKFIHAKTYVGDEPGKTTNGSCQFILHPKDLTRPVSECCYPTVAACPNVPSTETLKMKKMKRKSQSMTSICRERVAQDFIDMMIVHEDPIAREVAKHVAPCHQTCKTFEVIKQRKSVTKTDNNVYEKILQGSQKTCQNQTSATEPKALQVSPKTCTVDEEYKSKEIKAEPIQDDRLREAGTVTARKSICKCEANSDKRLTQPVKTYDTINTKSKLFSKLSSKRFGKADVSCQCPEEDIIKFDTSTQYNPNDFKSCCNTNLVYQKAEEPYPMCSPEFCNIRTVINKGKAVNSLSTLRNDGAQTSDHSIHIETGNGHEPSFFMKIICADKFNSCGCY